MEKKCEWCGGAITDTDYETNFTEDDEEQFFHLLCSEEIQSMTIFDWVEMEGEM